MEVWRVTEDLRYLVQGFPIMKLGNWCDETERGGNLEGRRKVDATCQGLTHSINIMIEKQKKYVVM